MKTRTGKIAQLPKLIRDDLNHRLANGKQAPELLKWLNGLRETKELIATKFDNHPISPQNLTEWRQGGYQEWLRHQEREQRIKRLAEEGTDLKDIEGEQDLFEHTARIALAELMVDLDDLHQLKGNDRWERLRFLTRELARLQNSFNRSRWTELEWTRWNDRFLGPDDYEPRNSEFKQNALHPPRSAECHSAESPTASPPSVALAERTETPTPSPISQLPSPMGAEIIPNQTKSTTGEGNNGAPAPRVDSAGRVALPRDPIIRHERPASDESPSPTTTPPPQADSLRPLTPSSPIPLTPLTDFLRKMSHLKTASK
jgi:hypothetical protein